MEDDPLKRKTDCVYFLASPLTCKKGVDCEYRHNELSRLNPRDCRYWLAGNCLNPTCAFRHPPLDGHAELPSDSSVHVNKRKAPCYFFFNGFCNKGGRCLFSHSTDDGTSAGKFIKTGHENTNASILETKTYVGHNGKSASVSAETHSNTAALNVVFDSEFYRQSYLHVQQAKIVMQHNASSGISVHEHEEVASAGSDSLLPDEGFVHDIAHLSNDQDMEEDINNCAEPEDHWESSPGFDVLVDHKANNINYEDAKYPQSLEKVGRELHGHFSGYGFEDANQYNPISYANLLCEDVTYDDCNGQDSNFVLGRVRKLSAEPRDVMLESVSRKRKCLSTALTGIDRNMDLRDYLRKRRECKGFSTVGLSTRCECSSVMMVPSHNRCQTHGTNHWSCRRLIPEVELNSEKFEKSQHRSREHKRKERVRREQFLSSAKSISRGRMSIENSTTLTGPKRLAQIKAEEKAEEIRNFRSADFQGPKPLSEILEDKRRLGCMRGAGAITD